MAMSLIKGAESISLGYFSLQFGTIQFQFNAFKITRLQYTMNRQDGDESLKSLTTKSAVSAKKVFGISVLTISDYTTLTHANGLLMN